MRAATAHYYRSWHTVAPLAIAMLLVMSVPLHAEPNSAARVAAFAKLPDWSGLWEQVQVPASGLLNPMLPDSIELQHPPYNAVWQAKMTAILAVEHPSQKSCTWGFPGLSLFSPLMFQAMVLPEETTLEYDQRETRHIYTDGRKHPGADALFPTAWGDSVGHWEGQTLVVDTIGISAPFLVFSFTPRGLERVPLPLSDQVHFIERIRMLDHDTLENQITIDDPEAFTHPWVLTRHYHRVNNLDRLIDEDCDGNDRNPSVNGQFVISPP